jgi:hypothetical protein
MPYLAAATALVGAVALTNLLLTFGVIRRLREHTELLSRSGGSAGAPGRLVRPAGARVDEFVAHTVDGEPVGRDLLRGQTLIGFFSPGCRACEERMPAFVTLARALPGGRSRVLAVIVGPSEEAAAYRERVAPVARVVVQEEFDGPLTQALDVVGFPAFALVAEDGEILGSGLSPADLPLPGAGSTAAASADSAASAASAGGSTADASDRVATGAR